MELQISRLTDDDIYELTGDSVLTDSRDFNLDYDRNNFSTKRRLYPYKGGVYDTEIFGSLNPGRCMCTRTKAPNVCPKCGTEALTEGDMYRRYARIESPVYFLQSVRVKEFIKFLKSSFSGGIVGRLDKKSLDIYQMNYDSELDQLEITDEITDVSSCSYEGLIQLFQNYKSEGLPELMSWINKYILVTPPVMRRAIYAWKGRSSELSIPIQTAVYQGIIMNLNYYRQVLEGFGDAPDEEISYFRGIFRKVLTENLVAINELLASSKANLARNTYGKRILNSGRAPIVANPKLNIDEVSIPFHLAYEICKSDFIKYLIENYDYSYPKALDVYNAMDPFTKEDFLDWSQNRKVLLNRNPTLHEFNIMALKLRVNNDYAIGLPILICSPFNADKLSMFAR